MQKNLPYIIATFITLDFILGGLLGWFSNPVFLGLALLFIFLLFVLKLEWGIVILIFSQTLDTVTVLGLRPYHWIAFLFVLALTTKALLRVFGFSLFEKSVPKDRKQSNVYLKTLEIKKEVFASFEKLFRERKLFLVSLILLVIASFLGIINASNKFYSLKQTAVLMGAMVISVLICWWIGRDQKRGELAIKAYFLSSLPVGIFAIYQNIAHERNWESFEVMTARPNASFYEPDWLGIYTVLVLGSLLSYSMAKNLKTKPSLGIWGLIFVNTIVLVISVARASWVATIAVGAIFIGWGILGFLLKKINKNSLKKSIFIFLKFGGVLVISLFLIEGLNLTRFNLSDRLVSIYKGEHIITIAEKDGMRRKINLEEIETYKQNGFQISEEKISDENVESRYEAYASNWEMVKKHWILGQGQGSVMSTRNFVYNANNIFWEWWIASGLLGFASFVVLIAGMLKGLWRKKAWSDDILGNQLLVLLGMVAIIITGLFNSGIFFMPIWIFLGIVYGIKNENKSKV